MAALYDLREELTVLLRQGLPDAAVTGEYPGEGRRYPQTVPAVAVGIAEAALQKLDYLGRRRTVRTPVGYPVPAGTERPQTVGSRGTVPAL